MNINYKETQYNFLEKASLSSQDPRSPRVLSAQLVLSVENLVIFTIASIMVMLFCFSIGVERGKAVAFSDDMTRTGTTVHALHGASEKVPLEGDDDILSSGEEKKDIFETLAFWGAKRTTASSATVPGVGQTVPEPKLVKDPKASGVQPKPVKVAQAEKASATSAPSGVFTVQVGSYKSEKSATREAQSLKQKGFRDVYVLPKGSFVIVCVGSFPTKTDASTFTRQLKDRYQDTVVRRL